MIWLQSPPWLRWTLAVIISGLAVWTEFRPEGLVEHPFAVVDIAVGDPITDTNTELRRIPPDLLEPAPSSGFATSQILAGQPLNSRAIADEAINTRPGWWSLEVPLPRNAALGDDVQLVLTDTGEMIPGLVSMVPDEDPLGTNSGAVAVPPEHSAAVAVAVASGRMVVLVSTQ